MSPLKWIGRLVLGIFEGAGRLTLLLFQAGHWVLRGHIEARQTLAQMAHIGVDALPIIAITGAFAGAVLAYQTASQLVAFGVPGYVGGLVALSLAREAAPVFTAVTTAGRSGGGIAAELGTMAVTEQLDALRVMATDPVRYLVVPRLLAGVFALPLLTVGALLAGMVGGWGVASLEGVGTATYLSSVRRFLTPSDIVGGLFKSALFGMIIALIGSHRGMSADGGAAGVGRAATGAVVAAIVLILVGNLFLDVLLF